MAIAASPTEQRFLLPKVGWDTYWRLREEPESLHVRMTYDQGVLELMSPSRKHGNIAEFVGWLIYVWCEVAGIAVDGCRDMTIRRQDLDKGIEPDNCYYLAHEPQVRGREELDFSVDPPPDLAVEVEVTRSALDRLAIYAALRVPEVWRTDGRSLAVHVLRRGRYVKAAASKALPGFPVADVPRWLATAKKIGGTAMIRQFRKQVEAAASGNPGERPV